jgi:hypothetical protein
MSTERKIEKCWMKNTYKESKKKHTGKSMEDTHRETGKSWMRDTERSWMWDTGKSRSDTERSGWEIQGRYREILCPEKFLMVNLSAFHLFAMGDIGKCGGNTRRDTGDRGWQIQRNYREMRRDLAFRKISSDPLHSLSLVTQRLLR